VNRERFASAIRFAVLAGQQRRLGLPGSLPLEPGPIPARDLGKPTMGHSATEATASRLFRTRLLSSIVAGLGGFLAAALFLGVSDGGLPRPVHAEVALAAAAAPAAPGLCFSGPGGELLDSAPAGQGCR
jgi:hypothetical protein